MSEDQTERFDALGYDFAVSTAHPELFDHFAAVFRHLRSDGTPSHLYELRVGAGEHALHLVTLDGNTLVETRWPVEAFRRVVWHVNQQVIATAPYLLLHAGAVAVDGRVIGLPAPMESGKSTLTAGLVEAGASYLSDEFVALDHDAGEVVPYPRAISLDEGSWDVLGHLRPSIADSVAPFVADQWQVDPDTIRPGSVGSRGPLDTVVFPKYATGSETRLTPMTRGEALVELAHNTFHFQERARASLAVLADAVRSCRCYRLTFADLKTAVDLVLRVVHS